MINRTTAKLAPFLGLLALSACRGQSSDAPPVHMNPNMDSQPRYDPQSESKLYEDRRSMRVPVEGTIPKGHLNEDEAYANGKDGDRYVLKIPVPITEQMLTRGQERFNIYCTPCHDKMGTGKGMVALRGYPPPTDLQEPRVRSMSDGQLYAAIAFGVRNMPSYGAQIPVADRWAIVAYVRALELSQNATIEDVPAEKRASLPEGTP
jgi:mono/diheme cytochrome c family protein